MGWFGAIRMTARARDRTHQLLLTTPVTEAAGEQTGPKKKLSRKKKEPAVVSMEMPQDTQSSVAQVVSLTTEPATVEPLPKKNFRRSVGQRKPQQYQVGE
jgi:hypothetical protein